MLKKVTFILLTALFLAGSAPAQTPPADSIIKAVVADLDRYEKQAEGLTPRHKPQIKRIARMLPLTESRLKGSKNKSHPSWVEASERLAALKAKLAALQSGKPAASKPAGSAGGMTDKQIAAKYNQDYRALGQELNATPISKFADQAVAAGFQARLDSLKKLVDSLQSDKNRQSFTAHYRKLETYFNKKVAHAQGQAAKQARKEAPKPAPAKAKPAPKPAAKPAGPLDYQNKRALGFFNKDYNRYLKEFDQVTPANTAKLKGYLARLDNRLSKLTAKDHPEVVAAQEKVAALKAKLANPQAGGGQAQASPAGPQSDAKTHKEFQKLYQRNRVALDFLDPAELAKPAEAKHWRKVLAQFGEIVAKFQNKEDAQVGKDLEMYARIKAKIESGLAASAKVDINSYPYLDQDQDFLNSLYDKYSRTKIFAQGNEAVAKQLLADYDRDKAAFDQLDEKYSPFIKGNEAASSPAYKQAGDLKRSFRNAGQWLAKFAKARDDYIAGAGPRIEKLLAKAAGMVDQAINEKRPEWFTGGGIQHAMIQAGNQIASLTSIKGGQDAQVKELRAKHEALLAKVRQAESGLKESILAATKLPADAYSGGDKSKIMDLALAAWSKKHPDKKPLAKGISMPTWERKTEWRYKVDGTRYKVDRSYLQVWVAIKTSETIATQYFIELSKNHLQGGTITLNAPSNLGGDVLKTEMLLKNVK